MIAEPTVTGIDGVARPTRSFEELDKVFRQYVGPKFDGELSMPQILRIRRGFETETPLTPRGYSIPKPNGPRGSSESILRAFDEEGAGSDGHDRIYQAEADYVDVCDNLTGMIVPDEVVSKSRERRALQDATTVSLAKALEERPLPPAHGARCPDCRLALRPPAKFYHGENWENRCTVIGAFSGEVLPLPPVRRVSFFPSQAASQRSKMLRDVEQFLGLHPTTSRMFTITNGPRVPIHPITLREDVKGFHRWLSKMAANPAFKAFGLRMQWRATEFGEPKWDEDSGQLTLHLHAHVLVTEPVGISKKRRAKLRKKLWKVFGVHWDDAGTIENAREFVKYPVKDSDLETIKRLGGAGALADFYDAIRGLHIVQPLGDLKLIRAERRAVGKRIYALSGADGRYLTEKFDVNAQKRPLSARKDGRERYLKRALWVTLMRNATAYARLRRGDSGAAPLGQTGGMGAFETGQPGGSGAESEGEPGGSEAESNAQPGGKKAEKEPLRIVNRVIARLAPAPYGGPICEPAVVVWGFDGNTLAVMRHPLVARIRARHRAAYADAVHARDLTRECAQASALAPLTRATRAAGQGSQRSNNCPRAESPPGPSLADLALADAENDRN